MKRIPGVEKNCLPVAFSCCGQSWRVSKSLQAKAQRPVEDSQQSTEQKTGLRIPALLFTWRGQSGRRYWYRRVLNNRADDLAGISKACGRAVIWSGVVVVDVC